jgi:GNAT superfamily N-acetyltransferase
MSTREIRPAQEGDAAAILECLAVAFAPYRERYTPAAFADTVLDRSILGARMQKMHILVAVSDGQIVGTVAGSTDESGEGHLRGMAVLPKFHGTGIASRLLLAIEEWLQAQGCTRVSLGTTLPLQAAIKFYEKCGYSRSGTVRDFFGMPLIEYVKSLD